MKPDQSTGDAFFRYAYRYIATKTKIDPVVEGLRLRQRLQSLLAGNDFQKLKDKKEREARQLLADQLIDQYGERFKRFNRHFYNYCFARGRLRAVEQLGSFMQGARSRVPRILRDYKKVLEEL